MIFIYLLAFAYGAVIGSFLNVVILRLQKGKSLGGRSVCPHCGHQLATLDLIPIFSYLLQGGKCRYCGRKLSLQYPLVELVTALAFSFYFLVEGQSLFFGFPFTIFQLLINLFAISVLIVVLVYDLRWGIIPDKIIIPSAILALLANFFLFLLNTKYEILNTSIKNYAFDLLTAFGIGLFFLLLILITRGRGMGGGDLKLSVFIGLFLGFPLGFIAILLGFLTGALGSVMLLLLGKKGFKETVPFGPFLALGAYISLLFGNYIWTAYLKALGF